MKLFGTAGIRGITNRDITPELAVGVSKAYGTVFGGKIALARDNRHGAEMISRAVAAGLMSTGAEVHDLGIVPLPVFARYVSLFMDGGIIVTGSHTPPDILGIVAVDSLGRDLYWDKSRLIENTYEEGKFKIASWERIKDSQKDDAIETYTRYIEEHAKGIDGFSVLLDLANGTACGLWNTIMENLGVKVDCIHCTRKHVPDRPSEPRSTTLKEMGKLSANYDLSAGVDVDADRVVFARKEFISEDVAGAIFASRFAKKMVTPINSSSLVDVLRKEHGIDVIYCPIGPPEIAEAMIKNKADFGYEETGKYVFPPNLWGDSLLSIVKMLTIMNREGKTINDLANEFPRFYQVKEKIPVVREKKWAIVDALKEKFKNNPPDDVEQVVTVDGVKLIYKDSWLLIRASGTEDVIRVFSDSISKEKARALVEFGMKEVHRLLV